MVGPPELIDVVQEQPIDLDLKFDGDTAEWSSACGTTSRVTVRRSSLTPSAASQLVQSSSDPQLVVADLIHSGARHVLEEVQWSYWDRRGFMHLVLPEIGVAVRTDTRSFVKGADGPDPLRPVAGRGGVSLALGLLELPNDAPGVREIARMSEMAPSTISRARQRLMQVALVDTDGAPVVPELFWATSDAWVVELVTVDEEPHDDGWVLAGDAAAASWGAPVLAGSRRYYCADRALFDRHRLRHGAEDSAVQVAMAPSPLVVASAIDGVVHPVVAALDLSTSSRGREVLGDWTAVDPALPGSEVVWQ
jgi:hypothetical protein